MRGASLVKVFNLLMLCEVIAYILSRQRLSAKTFVTGCVFYALQDRLSLWVLCDTSGVEKLSASPSHGFALWASPAVTHSVSPLGTVGAGWEVSFFSPSPLSTGDARAERGWTRGGMYREDSDASCVALQALRE